MIFITSLLVVIKFVGDVFLYFGRSGFHLGYRFFSFGTLRFTPRVAKVGSLSARAKLPTKIFVWRVFAIFATNASFLRVIANLEIQFSIICNMYHLMKHLLPKKHCF